jgi:hypothetical protein
MINAGRFFEFNSVTTWRTALDKSKVKICINYLVGFTPNAVSAPFALLGMSFYINVCCGHAE